MAFVPIATAKCPGSDRSIPFTRGSELRNCKILGMDVEQRGSPRNGYGPYVIPFEPACASTTGLQATFPNSRLAGWWVFADRDGDLMFTIEDPRARDLAGYAMVELHAGSPLGFVAAIMSDTAANAMFREYALYRIDDTELTLLMHERIFVGERGETVKNAGWDLNLANHCDVPGVRNPLGIWSWNGDDSEFAASLQLQPGCISGFWPHSKWQDTPIERWPHPLWVLFYWFDPH